MLHMMLDIYKCHNTKFNNMLSINNLIGDICAQLDLKPVAPPTIVPFYYGKVADDDGISAFVLLEGGHFTIHTFYKRRCAFVDLLFEEFEGEYLCKMLTKRANVIKNGEVEGEQVYVNSWEIDRNCKNAFVSIDQINKFKRGVEKNFSGFGPHYFVTAKCKKPLTLQKIYDILDHMPQKAVMTPITRPFVVYDKIDEPRFVSGIVVIAESHISIHYDIKEQKLYFDMFTCRPLPSYTMKNAFFDSFEEIIDKDTMIDALIERGQDHVYSIKSRAKTVIRTNWKKGTWIENIYAHKPQDETKPEKTKQHRQKPHKTK